MVSQNTKSILWSLLWSLSFSSAVAASKFLSPIINTPVLAFIRYAFGFLFFLPFLFKGDIQTFKTKRFPLHFLRVLLGYSALLCTYYAYRKLPLAFATTIGFTGPLITTLLAIFILKSRVSRKKWLALFLGYLGVLIMIHPKSIDFNPAILIALMANFFAGCVMVTVKKLTTTESTLTIMFYLNIISVLISGIGASLTWQTPSARDLLILAFLGAAGAFSHFCSVQSLKNGDPTLVAPFEYSRIVFAVPIGFLLFQEIPTLLSLIGGLIIILSTGYLTLSEIKKNA